VEIEGKIQEGQRKELLLWQLHSSSIKGEWVVGEFYVTRVKKGENENNTASKERGGGWCLSRKTQKGGVLHPLVREGGGVSVLGKGREKGSTERSDQKFEKGDVPKHNWESYQGKHHTVVRGKNQKGKALTVPTEKRAVG